MTKAMFQHDIVLKYAQLTADNVQCHFNCTLKSDRNLHCAWANIALICIIVWPQHVLDAIFLQEPPCDCSPIV